ncbi:periodic tryptophan protein 2-like protein [Abeliophyllum distichum]|uniref:Periodic tryptophan protein 2-like protein n=1 Tax=Abeliophyllum distichum TaxID=126358 RepID=A0ABD1VBB1_9LAMI
MGLDMVVVGFSNEVFGLYQMPNFVCIYLLSISREKIKKVVFNDLENWLTFGCAEMGQLLVWEWKLEGGISPPWSLGVCVSSWFGRTMGECSPHVFGTDTVTSGKFSPVFGERRGQERRGKERRAREGKGREGKGGVGWCGVGWVKNFF